MSAFAEAVKNEATRTTTLNGATTLSTSTSSLVDFFFMGGASRNKTETELTAIFDLAFKEDPETALRTLFYIRDIRGGLGERKVFRTVLKHLALTQPLVTSSIINKVSKYGRWDDLWCLLDTPLKSQVITLIKDTADNLLYKWLPSINTSSNETVRYAKIIAKGLELNHKQYRKLLSSNRRVLESQLCRNEWDNVEFSKVPSKAMIQYRKAFIRHTEERFNKYLDSVNSGEVKINTGALYPYDIFNKSRGVINKQDEKALDVMWKNLPNYVTEGSGNSLVMADVSGSMDGHPMAVSVSLAIYMAERNKGAFKDIFMSFDNEPNFHRVIEGSIVDKIDKVLQTPWGMSTNLERAFVRILELAKNHNIPQQDMPEVLYIISDMEFNQATRANSTLFETAKALYKEADYELPSIVFWNVYSLKNNVPAFSNEKGVYLVSGCSPVVFKSVASMDFGTPYDYMMSVVGVERYNNLTN